MKKFSSSYGGTKENFIVKIFSKNVAEVDKKFYAALYAVQNIFQRGTPTKPSDFLISKLSKITAPPVYLIDNSKIIWNNRKGDDETGYYPARTFYDKILSEILGEYSFCQEFNFA